MGLLSLAAGTGLASVPGPLGAASRTQTPGYALDLAATEVTFGFRLNGIWQKGTMPIASSKVMLDPKRLTETRVAVSLDARAAKTGLIFATKAMTGPDVLDVTRFPTISFVTRRVLLGPEGRLSNGAELIGDLTLRGVTLPLSLQIALFRRIGSAADDLSRLDVTLHGSLSRSAYGASGYAGLVGDIVRLDIRASLHQVA
ncbi:YceI family protein [Pseudophaeobacter arcticus]|jgi:polyisoprenoid-binding protein YceI|nr:YceI family protein [Pseudophaeobacter arcticus]